MPSEPQKRECRCPRARHRHGTYGAYRTDRCRCLPCRLYVSRAGADRRYDDVLVSAVGTARRLRALAWSGWGAYVLAERLGVTHTAVESWRAMRSATVRRETAERVAALYDQLWNVTRPNRSACIRARAAAERAGWLPPLAWDDDTIDDPDAQLYTDGDDAPLDEIAIERAMHGDPVRLTPAERTEAVARLTARGYSAHEIGQRLHVTERTVQRKRAA